jgi:hypothetical protein
MPHQKAIKKLIENFENSKWCHFTTGRNILDGSSDKKICSGKS